MKIVVDTNILFSFFKEISLTRSLILSPDFTLLSPETALAELNKYSGQISKKSKNQNFEKEFGDLEKVVSFVPPAGYKKFLAEAERISPGKDDAPFLALSIKEKCSLWSNDSALKNQEKVNVLSTNDLIDVIF
jgi:predicted nucleic acid-binding protein